jgi:hypothetical protein
MISPVVKILRRKDMVVLHDEPIRAPLVIGGRPDVVRQLNADHPVEHARRRVGGELIRDEGVGRECSVSQQHSGDNGDREKTRNLVHGERAYRTRNRAAASTHCGKIRSQHSH